MNKQELIEMLKKAIAQPESVISLFGTKKFVVMPISEATDLLRELEDETAPTTSAIKLCDCGMTHLTCDCIEDNECSECGKPLRYE